MCGIAGVLRLTDAAAPPGREELQRMAGALQHRGPDEFGLYRDRQAGLAHARLSIIDPRGGQQPLQDPTASGIRESGERPVELRILNHLVQCCTARERCQVARRSDGGQLRASR